MNNRFVVILLVCIALFLGLFIFNSNDDKQSDKQTQATTSNHIAGNPEASVQLVEYGDFQCPACAGYYPILQQVKDKYGDRIAFQFRHFPIVSIHPNAMSAHRAAEAAGQQGKFWEMHDLLYERQDSWKAASNPAQIFESYARELGLDIDAYNQAVAASSTKDTIDADLQAGKDAGIDATPGFMLNGKKIDNAPRDVEGFSALIDELLSAAPGSEQTQE